MFLYTLKSTAVGTLILTGCVLFLFVVALTAKYTPWLILGALFFGVAYLIGSSFDWLNQRP